MGRGEKEHQEDEVLPVKQRCMRCHYRVKIPQNNRQDLNVTEESRLALLYFLDDRLLFLLTSTSFSIHYFPLASLPPDRSHVSNF